MFIEKCTDCGSDVVGREHSGLSNICDVCWDNRGWLVKNLSNVGQAELLKIQHLIRGRTGGAKRAIENFRYPSYSI